MNRRESGIRGPYARERPHVLVYDCPDMRNLRSIPRRRAFRRIILLASVLVLPSGAQNPQNPHGAVPSFRLPGEVADDRGNLLQVQERLRALNRQRQKNIVDDTGKLLKLAGELDMEVESSGEERLTAAQLRKIAEIEKLAHSVREKMSYSVNGLPVFEQPLPFQNR